MDYLALFEEFEGVEDLDCEASDQLHIQTVVVVAFYQLIEILTEKLENNALCYFIKLPRAFGTPQNP